MSYSTPSYARENKGHTRTNSFEFVFQECGRSKPYGSILTLPSREALCVRELERLGHIDSSTKQVWVERKKSFIPILTKRAKDRNVEVVKSDLEDFTTDETFDLINADMESTITPKLAKWLEQMPLRDNGNLILTLTAWHRGNPFYDEVFELLDDPILVDQVECFRAEIGACDKQTIVPLVILNCAIQSDGRFVAQHYKDTTGMLSIMVSRVRKSDTAWPSLDELMRLIDTKSLTRRGGKNKIKSPIESLRDELEIRSMKLVESSGGEYKVLVGDKLFAQHQLTDLIDMFCPNSQNCDLYIENS